MQHQHIITDEILAGPQSQQRLLRTMLAAVPTHGFGKEMYVYPLDIGTNLMAGGSSKASDVLMCPGGIVSLPAECAMSIEEIEKFEKNHGGEVIPKDALVVFCIGSSLLEIEPGVLSFLHVHRKVKCIATASHCLHMEGQRPASPLPIVFQTRSEFGHWYYHQNETTIRCNPDQYKIAIVMPLRYGFLSEKRLPTSLVTLNKSKITLLKDCTQQLTPTSSYLKGSAYTAFPPKLCCPAAAAINQNQSAINTILMTCDQGSHVDSASHFFDPAKGARTITDYTAQELFAPAVIIDITNKVPKLVPSTTSSTVEDPSGYDVTVDVEDLLAWEDNNNREIPPGSLICMKSGWSQYFNEGERYNNFDPKNHEIMHFPGFSIEAAEWLVKNRRIAGLAVDTLSTDIGGTTSYPVHKKILGSSLYNVENLDFSGLDNDFGKNMFHLIVAPLSIKGAPEAPCRVIAVTCEE